MALEIDEAGVKFIVQNLEAYLRDLDKANDATKEVGDKTATSAEKSSINWKKIGTAAAVAATAVATAVVAIGATMIKLAGSFDDAYDSIQVKTGATGEELGKLQDSFKNVFSSIPADGGDVATAMGTIAQKTDATGVTLETLTKQVVELSRITGTDLATNLDSVVGAFQRWGISADAMPVQLDAIFRASQESGLSVADLSQSLADNKATLDALGYSLPESINLIGSLGKSGIDADTAFGGLTIALRKMAQEGVTDPQAALAEYIDQIKNAGTTAEATSIGVELFGRQSIALVDVIRSGSLDVDAFTAAVADNKNGILDTAEQTNDWREKLDILKNKLLVEVEPALMAIFTAVTDGVEAAGPAIEKFREWFEENVVPAIKEAARVFEEDWLPVLQRVGETLQAFWDEIGSVIFENIVRGVRDIGAVFKEVAETIGAIIDGDWSGAMENLKELVSATWEFIKGIVEGYVEVLGAVGMAVFTAIYDAADAVYGDLIRGISEWMNERVIAPIASFTESLRTKGAELFGALWEGMSSIAGRFYELGSDIVGQVIQGLIDNWGRILSWITDHLPSPDDLLPDWLGMVAPPTRPWTNPNEVPDPWTDPNRPIVPDWWTNPENDPRTPFLPPDKRPMTQPKVEKSKVHPGLLPPDELPKPGEMPKLQDPTRINIDAITDPARFLELVMNAIATIEQLADADVPQIARPKLKRLAMNLRNIIVEFGQAMKGVSLEASENAAVFAGFLDPILDAVEKGVDALDALAGAEGVGLPRIKAILGSIANVARESIERFGKMDAGKVEKTALVSGYVADIMENVRRAADALIRDGGIGGGGIIPGGDGGGIPGAIGDATDAFAKILAGIVAGLPARGSTLQGAPGGITYNVNAVYQNPQNPSSIRLDLIELSMLAAA